jgi:hypothetical protein
MECSVHDIASNMTGYHDGGFGDTNRFALQHRRGLCGNGLGEKRTAELDISTEAAYFQDFEYFVDELGGWRETIGGGRQPAG